MSNSSLQTTHAWWNRLHPRLTILYLAVALVLLALSAMGHIRLLNEIGNTFGGFFWAIDTDGQVVVVSEPQLFPSTAPVSANSLTSNDTIVAVNGVKGYRGLTQTYAHAHPDDLITYTVQHNAKSIIIHGRAVTFTLDMWWQNYGLGFLAGLSWLAVGALLLATAQDWSGAVEGITLLPPAMLLLLYSHWGNVQQPYFADAVFQLLWVPSFALLGAAFIHLSLTYRPEALSTVRRPRMVIDVLPYLPLIALFAYEWSSYALYGYVLTRSNLLVSLGYAVLGGAISFCIGIKSLVRVGRLLPWGRSESGRSVREWIPAHIRRRIGDLLTLWIGGVGLGFCLGVLPILLTGQTLLPLSMFYLLAAVYPLVLWYAIRSLRLIDRLQLTLEQRETALLEQHKTAEALRQTNCELQQATSLLLRADAHLRSLLSQRIHDQPKQEALRIRSLLAYWQHKMRVEAEHNPDGKVPVQLVIEALGKIRKISEVLESDLRGLQLLVEDVYQRRSLGLKLHLDKLIQEDLPALHPESPIKVQADLGALDALSANLEQTPEGAKMAEAISYTVTQALLNVYNHSGATFATVRTASTGNMLEVYVIDDGRGFDPQSIPPEKTSLFKARLKAREAGGMITIQSIPLPMAEHGTVVLLRIPLPPTMQSNGETRLIVSGSVEKMNDEGAIYRTPT